MYSSSSHNSRLFASRRRRRTSLPGTTSGLHLVQTVSDKRVAGINPLASVFAASRGGECVNQRVNQRGGLRRRVRVARGQNEPVSYPLAPNNGEPAESQPTWAIRIFAASYLGAKKERGPSDCLLAHAATRTPIYASSCHAVSLSEWRPFPRLADIFIPFGGTILIIGRLSGITSLRGTYEGV